MKKSGILLLVVLSLFGLFTGPFVADTQATTAPPLNDTYWAAGGSFTAAIKFPNYVELSIKLPKLETYWSNFGIGEIFAFNGDGTFEDLILSLLPLLASDVEVPMPTWTQNGSNFAIDLTGFSSALKNALQNALGDIATIEGAPTKPPTFSGKIDSRGATISGKLTINYNLSITLGALEPINGTLSLTMTFKGTPYTPTSSSASARAAFNSASTTLWSKANSEGTLKVFSVIKNAISEIKALVPTKRINLLKSH